MGVGGNGPQQAAQLGQVLVKGGAVFGGKGAVLPGQQIQQVKPAPVVGQAPLGQVGAAGPVQKIPVPHMPQPQVVQPPGLEHRRCHAAGAQPVVVQRPVHAGGGLAVADQMHDVAVVAVAEAGVEPAALPQPGVEQLVPADDGIDAAAGEQVAEQFQRRPHAGGLHIHVAAGQRAAVFVNAVSGTGGHAAAARLQRGQQHGVKVRLHQIVGVHKADVVPGDGVQPGVAGAGRTAVRLVDDPHPAVLRGQPVAQFAAAVGAAVLHQQQLQIVVGLGQHAAHRQRQQVFGVVHRHDNADLFFCSRHGRPPGMG